MRLRVFQSLWGMSGLPFNQPSEWSTAEKIEKLIDAGFDGIDIGWTPTLPAEEALRLAHTAGLDFGISCFPRSVEEFGTAVSHFGTLQPRPQYLNLQPNHKVFDLEAGARYIRGCLRVAADAGFRICVETHRDRMTTDLRFTLQLLEAVPEMSLTADLSHYVVGQEFAWPITEDDNELIRRILQRSDIFHGRVSSREQVQIAVNWPGHEEWLELFLGWWRQGFASWIARADHDHDHDLIFVTELGPRYWYAITGPDGEELSDRWADSLILRDRVRAIWAALQENDERSG
jgi:sugar phosphate isomerase/epimerase